MQEKVLTKHRGSFTSILKFMSRSAALLGFSQSVNVCMLIFISNTFKFYFFLFHTKIRSLLTLLIPKIFTKWFSALTRHNLVLSVSEVLSPWRCCWTTLGRGLQNATTGRWVFWFGWRWWFETNNKPVIDQAL